MNSIRRCKCELKYAMKSRTPIFINHVTRALFAMLLSSSLFAIGDALGQSPSTLPSTAGSALQSFEIVRSVLQHPRCQNCHIPGDAPFQGDVGHPHAQGVLRGPDGHGAAAMECAVCHQEKNLPMSYGYHVPPGAPKWHLPPPATKMVFIDLSPRELCTAIKNRALTGGKDLPAMMAHIRDDGLVAWGWDPGEGRAPVPVSRADTVAAFKTWMDAGAPCPQ
jgi:hypothetical protein